MAKRRSNQSRYKTGGSARKALPTKSDWDAAIESGHNPDYAHDLLGASALEMPTFENLLETLDALAMSLGEPAFERASEVLKAYNFEKGALKRQILRLLSDGGARSIDDAVNVRVQLEQIGKSKNEAAQFAVWLTGAKGYQGGTFESVVTHVRKGDSERLLKHVPADTGKRLIVEWKTLLQRQDGSFSRAEAPPDTEHQRWTNGRFIVPDNRRWRRLVRSGHAIVHATFDPSDRAGPLE